MDLFLVILSNRGYKEKTFKKLFTKILLWFNLINFYMNCGFTRISSPEKSHDCTLKITSFCRVFDIANQLLTRHSPFAPLCQVDE